MMRTNLKIFEREKVKLKLNIIWFKDKNFNFGIGTENKDGKYYL